MTGSEVAGLVGTAVFSVVTSGPVVNAVVYSMATTAACKIVTYSAKQLLFSAAPYLIGKLSRGKAERIV